MSSTSATDEPLSVPSQATPNSRKDERALVTVDLSRAHTAYANFCRVTGTPEELILDFGLNSQPMAKPNEPIEISERVVMNYFTAKRMLAALQMSLQRHEAAFGVLETNVQNRVLPGLQSAAQR